MRTRQEPNTNITTRSCEWCAYRIHDAVIQGPCAVGNLEILELAARETQGERLGTHDGSQAANRAHNEALHQKLDCKLAELDILTGACAE